MNVHSASENLVNIREPTASYPLGPDGLDPASHRGRGTCALGTARGAPCRRSVPWRIRMDAYAWKVTLLSYTPRSRILIAEDHLDSREAMRELLEAFGFDVIEAVNGRQAVDAALSQSPSLILMDVMMPEMDGVEAIRLLRETPQTHEIPIIALT